jgi:hypothetical protein
MLELRQRDPGGGGADPSRSASAEIDDADGTWLCCRNCGSLIAPASARFEAGGAPLVFANPHGMVFDIVTLSRANGARAFGLATSEFSWFAGYAWQPAMCARCHVHLGWRYQAAAAGLSPAEFYGLIKDELVERDTRG